MKRFLSVLPNDVKRPLRNARDFVIRVKNLMLYQGRKPFLPCLSEIITCICTLRSVTP